MDLRLYKDLCRSQFRSALRTLEQAIQATNDQAWNEEHLDGTVSQVVFHTLFFADLYLNPGEEGFQEQDFHTQNRPFFQDYEEMEDQVPVNTYSRKDCLKYLNFCFSKLEDVLESEDEKVLAGPSGFSWRTCSRAELHIYNMRHIQHHAAQLGLRLQLAGKDPLRWVGEERR
jgi:uncharacterized damage-inducible protein DinB